MDTLSKSIGAILVLLSVCFFGLPAQAKYSGGTGEPNNPYQIAKAEDLMLLGETPEDYDKHFILTADIDLDPNLPGRKVFDRAVIAPDVNDTTYSSGISLFEGTPFTGIFDGNGHTIWSLVIDGNSFLGLWGVLGVGARVTGLSIANVNISGSDDFIGGLIGSSNGEIDNCNVTGSVSGELYVGGLAGRNSGDIFGSHCSGPITGKYWMGGLIGQNRDGDVTRCHSNVTVIGGSLIGGLIGDLWGATVAECYSSGTVTGNWYVGGLVGSNSATITQCWNSAAVTGRERVTGGLAGANDSYIYECYNTGAVGGNAIVGGLVGHNQYIHFGTQELTGVIAMSYSSGAVNGEWVVGGLVGSTATSDWLYGGAITTASFWDVETSGQNTSVGGTGKTTAEMQTARLFLDAGWDFVDETDNGTEDIWWILEGQDYPRLWWEAHNN